MSITDELREWARGLFNTRETVLAIADRIDAEHQKALDEWKAENGKMWLKGYSECHDELLEGNETLASDLERCGWIRLPKNADGEYIHIGDKVTCGASVWEVTGFRLAGGGWGICCTIFFDQDGSGTNVYPPSELHHYRASTVEDVLEELLREYDHDDSELTNGEIIERFAAKLRLAGEGDE